MHVKGTRWRGFSERRFVYNRYMKRWRDANAYWSELSRSCRVRGITIDQYHAKAESQDFLCAICETEVSRLVIDHDHETGKFRGLLCSNCNTGIGLLKESARVLTAAQGYITKYA